MRVIGPHAMARAQQRAAASLAIDEMNVAVEVIAGREATIVSDGVVPEPAAIGIASGNVRIGIRLRLWRVVVAVRLPEILHRAVAQVHHHDPGGPLPQLGGVAHQIEDHVIGVSELFVRHPVIVVLGKHRTIACAIRVDDPHPLWSIAAGLVAIQDLAGLEWIRLHVAHAKRHLEHGPGAPAGQIHREQPAWDLRHRLAALARRRTALIEAEICGLLIGIQREATSADEALRHGAHRSFELARGRARLRQQGGEIHFDQGRRMHRRRRAASNKLCWIDEQH